MASSPLRSLILLFARLFLVGPVGRFILEGLILSPPKHIDPSSPDMAKESLQVIACGFFRSGTMSLMLALDRLGFKCYHVSNLLFSDWGYADKMGHCKVWLQAATEERWDDRQQILQGFSAVADVPATLCYKQLMAAYPNAKIILNVREPDQWHRSCMQTVFWSSNKLLYQVFRSDNYRNFFNVLWEGKFKGKFEDKEFAVNVYNSHVEEVTRIVPKEKLLVYDAKDGWAPLCSFLQVDIPSAPFPHGNDTATFRKRIRTLDAAYGVFSAVYVGLLSSVLALLLKWIFQFAVESSASISQSF